MARPGFENCCGGNDATPAEHTQDCHFSIQRFVAIEIAAKDVLKNPTNKSALKRLEAALRPLPLPTK